MPITVAELRARVAVEGLDQIGRDLDRAEGRLSSFAGGVGKAGSLLSGALAGIGFGAVEAGIGALGGAFGALKSSMIDTNAQLETGTVSWGVLLGSTEAAEKQLQSLSTFAAQTPFEFPEVQKAALLLQTFGGAALNSADNLKLVGDIASGVNQPFADVAMWYGRMYDAIKSGRPFGEAAARLQEMGAMSGETRAKLEDMQKTGADGTVIWSTFTGEMGRFGGMMEKQSQTFSGRLSTMRDSLNMLAAQAGKPIFDLLSRGLGQLNGLLASPALAAFIQNLAGRLAAGIGRAVGGLTQLGGVARTLGRYFGIVASEGDDLNDFLADLPEGIRPIVGAIGRLVANLLPALRRGLNLVRDAAATFGQAFRGEWFGGATREINGFVRLVGVWATYLGGIVRAIGGLFSGQEGALGTFLRAMTATVGRFWTEIARNIGIEVPNIIRLFGQFLGFVGDKLREGIPIVWDAVRGWWTEAAAPQLAYWIEQLGGWFTGTALPFVGTFLARMGTAFGAWITGSAIPWLQKNLPEWINAVGTWFEGTAIPFVVTSLEDLGKRFGDWITGSAIPWLEAEWPKFTAKLVELMDSGPTVTEVGNAAIALGKLVGPKVAEGMNSGPSIGQVGDGVIAFIGATNQKINDNAPTWLTNWGEFGAKVGGAVNAGMTSGPSTADVGNGVIAFIAATNQKANENLPTWLTNWRKFGETVGGAVWAGMTSGPSVEQVGNAVGAFIGKVNEELTRRLPDWLTTWSGFGGAIGHAILNAIKAVFTPPWMRGDAPGGAAPGPGPAGGSGELEARQRGGPVSAGMRYLVGERGPELFVPRQPGMIVPAGASGGVTIHAPVTISFAGMQVSSGIGLEAVAQAAQSGIERGLRQGYGPGRVR